MTQEVNAEELKFIKHLTSFKNDPYGFVLFYFPWGKGALEDKTGPDEWQADILGYIRDQLKWGELGLEDCVNLVIQLAVASGHGIGKSALVAWIILWGLSTFPDTRGVVTANTETQLRTKTWPELSKWYHLFHAKKAFVLTATAIHSVLPDHERTWRIDIIPWSESNPEAFAGLHNQGKRIVIIYDEASAIADKIWEVTEGAMTDEGTQIIWAGFGNPTRNTGRFRECFRKFRHRWATLHVDGRTAKMTNKDKIDQWIADYGINSDFVKVRVLGQFPESSDRQFIPSNLAEDGRTRNLNASQYNFAPIILGVDPAWTGGDETVIYMRQGLRAKKLFSCPKNDNDVYIANVVARFEEELKADAVFIDLGYGTGIYSVGKTLKRNWQLVAFGSASPDPGYANLRSYMWGQGKQWLSEGGAYGDEQQLYDDMIGPETLPRLDGKIALESKQDMKDRSIPSPNYADALFLTFAMPVGKRAADNCNKDKQGNLIAKTKVRRR